MSIGDGGAPPPAHGRALRDRSTRRMDRPGRGRADRRRHLARGRDTLASRRRAIPMPRKSPQAVCSGAWPPSGGIFFRRSGVMRAGSGSPGTPRGPRRSRWRSSSLGQRSGSRGLFCRCISRSLCEPSRLGGLPQRAPQEPRSSRRDGRKRKTGGGRTTRRPPRASGPVPPRGAARSRRRDSPCRGAAPRWMRLHSIPRCPPNSIPEQAPQPHPPDSPPPCPGGWTCRPRSQVCPAPCPSTWPARRSVPPRARGPPDEKRQVLQ